MIGKYLSLFHIFLASLTHSSCPPYRTLSDCATDMAGTYNLVQPNSVFCPLSQGFTGCLYQGEDTSDHFCFKAGPSEQCEAHEDVTEATTASTHKTPTTTKQLTKGPTSCFDKYFHNTTALTDAEIAGLCCEENDCQANAGCFFDELSATVKTYCKCFLGYYLSPDNSSMPATGECKDMKTQVCSSTSSSGCYADEDYIICPYCKVFEKTPTEVALILTYTTGEGTYDTDPSDPMMYIGSSTSCPEEEQAMEVFWYCWYNEREEVVDPSHADVVVVDGEDDCQHLAYIYTPLACDYAKDI